MSGPFETTNDNYTDAWPTGWAPFYFFGRFDMFRPFIEKLNAVRRFDVVVNSKDISIGEIETPAGATRLALQADGEVLTLEPKGEASLVQRWAIPPDHFRRLPRELQAGELQHFARREPKELTLRAVTLDGVAVKEVRAALSGRYSAFDSADVLSTIEPYVAGFELARPGVDRDEMAVTLVQPRDIPVRSRTVGDVVRVGLCVRNNEVGEGSLGVDFAVWRLKCLNGLVAMTPEVRVVQRHVGLDRRAFTAVLRNAVANCLDVGMSIVGSMDKAAQLTLPNLDPADGKLQEAIVRVLRNRGAFTKEVQNVVRDELGTREEGTLYGLVNVLTGTWAKSAPTLTERLHRERIAGEVLALAA